MNVYESLSVYSTDTFSEHYSQTRSSLPRKKIMTTFHMKSL